jgi:pyruvate/2-oxoglutarate dehydrogenase complex dihydrolipoamide acyltransferase (E2) component
VRRRLIRLNGKWIADRYLIGGTVGVSEILAQIDKEIAQLQQVRSLLGGNAAKAPKKAAAAPAAQKPVKKRKKKKRNLTPEGRKRIAEAVKRRWAEQKKAASSK